MSTARDYAEARLDDFLSQFDEADQERILRYALDHIVPRMKRLPQPGEGALTGWTKPEEGLPELGVEVLVWSKEPWEKEPSMKLDTWNEQHEAPLSFSTQTIPIGPGWDNHDDFYSVIAWMPLPTPPGITSTPTGDSNG